MPFSLSRMVKDFSLRRYGGWSLRSVSSLLEFFHFDLNPLLASLDLPLVSLTHLPLLPNPPSVPLFDLALVFLPLALGLLLGSEAGELPLPPHPLILLSLS